MFRGMIALNGWNGVRACAAALATLALAGCGMSDFGSFLFGSSSNLEQLNQTEASGNQFQRAQFSDYAFLARSFGASPAGEEDALAEVYAGKALAAAQGSDVAPEEARTSDQQEALARLSRALGAGRRQAPADAARAQADYDCWIVDQAMPRSAEQCRGSLDVTLPQLESDVGIAGY